MSQVEFEQIHRLAAAEKTEWIKVPRSSNDLWAMPIYFTLGPDGTGVGRVEVTTASVEDIDADNANPGTVDTIMPLAWGPGDVSAIDSDSVAGVAAYRVVNVSGDIICTVRTVQ